MVNHDQSILIKDLLLELEPTGQPKSPFAPAVHAGNLHVSTPAFRHIVGSILTEEIDIPVGKLAFVDCGWQPGGAWVTMKVRSFIQQNVTLKAALSAAPNGNLAVQMLDARAGMLPLNRLLDPMLDQVVKRPGFIRTGAMEIELNVADLLRAQNVPLTWTARVHNVRVDADMLILGMGQ
jgi:hypothetical protein